MPSPYRLPSDVDTFEDGLLTREGGLAWTEDRIYAWRPSEAWTALPDPPSSIENGFRTPGGILVRTGDDDFGYWTVGSEEWAWWERESELPFSSAHPPIGDRLVGGDQRGLNDLRLLIYRATPEGLEQEGSVTETPDLEEELGFAFLHTLPTDASTSTEASPHLFLLSGETLHWRSLSEEAEAFQTVHLSMEEEVGWMVDQFPPSVDGGFPPTQPHVHENVLLLHRNSITPDTTLQVDLEEKTVAATGLAPLGRSRAPWRAYFEGRPDDVASLLDTLRRLPPPSEEQPDDAVELLDLVVQDGDVHTVLTDCGVRVTDGVSASENHTDSAPGHRTGSPPTDFEVGISSDAPLAWQLWLDQDPAMGKLCRKVATEPTGEELYVESVQVQVGVESCRRFFDELRGSDPPRSYADDFSYNGSAIRALFGPYGPEVADLVEAGLADEHTPVRVAACKATGARDGEDYSSLSILNREPVPDSPLWPDREALPREALWENLSDQAPEVRKAAAETCGFLRLSGSGDFLQPLLHETPFLDLDTENVRETTLNALRLIPEIPDATTEDIEDCVRSDPSPSLRTTAVKTLVPHSRGASSLEALIWSLGDTAITVANNMSDALIEHATALTPEKYHEFTDRWLLRYLGHRRDADRLTFEVLFPDQLPGSILAQRLISEDVRELQPMMAAEQLTPEDLNTTEETLQMAPAALSIAAVRAALFEDTPLASSLKASSPTPDNISEFERALGEHLLEKTYLDEIDDSSFNYKAPSMQAAEFAAAIHKRDPRLGRRLAALVLSELGLPSGETDGDVDGYRPLHARLRDFSGESPHEKCHRHVQQLAEADGAGGVLGLYVLAAEGDEEAEASLIDQLTTGRLNDVPIALPLLQNTSSFSARPDAFAEGTLLGPYLASDDVPLAYQWEAFEDYFHNFEGVETDHVSQDQWTLFSEACIGADELLSWNDRHGAALNLARLDDQRGRPAELWAERVDSIDEVPGDEWTDYMRDQLWAGSDAFWTAFWPRWPHEYGIWALYMLADRGDAEAAVHIEAALEEEAVPQQPATEALQTIRARTAS